MQFNRTVFNVKPEASFVLTSEEIGFPSGQTGTTFYANGLIMETELLAKELSRHKVHVN